jgi:large subunit ribosomal protein L22e
MVKSTKTKRQPKVVTVDATVPFQDEVFNMEDYQQFLTQRIKVAGKVGNLGENITLSVEGGKLSVAAKPGTKLPKRYLKYLTKKYLQREEVRNIFRIVADSKDRKSYAIKYYNVAEEGEETQE